MRRVVAAAILSCAACQTPAPERGADDAVRRIEKAVVPSLLIAGEPTHPRSLEARMAADGVPGLSVAVVLDGAIAWARGYGYADVSEGRRVNPETLFQAASISKPVAAMAALKLVEDGRLALDANVNDALTRWTLPDNAFTTEHKVTLRQLMTHTGGTTVWGFPGYARSAPIPTTIDILDGSGNTAPVRVWRVPGESSRYSGGGYTVLELLVSEVTGEPFHAAMDTLVLSPLAMEASTYEQPLPARLHARAATGYLVDGTPVDGKWHVYPERAAAGLWTTPSDLARYLIGVQQDRAGSSHVLTRETTEAMLSADAWGRGLGPVIEGDGARFGHGGSNRGFRARFTAFIDGSAGAVVMTNSDTGGELARELILTIGKEYGWPGLEPDVKQPVELAPPLLERLTGRYDLDEMTTAYDVTFENGKLFLTVTGDAEPYSELVPESETEFFFRVDGSPAVFSIDDGIATGILVRDSIRGRRR